ncbi:hypothetical protein Q5752_005710 [Cryptotrichosporon argae]
MPPVPSFSPATGRPVPASYLHTSSAFFQDTAGRAILLRGVNLSGASKAPVGEPSAEAARMWAEAEAGTGDWTGRPLALDDGSADVHLARLRAWGFNALRYVFTWEAIEHAGPGKYDHAFIDYTVRVLYKCKEYGFRVFMDPHQDVWSRFSGGSGAPLWTLYACGIDPRAIAPTYGALLHSCYPPEDPAPARFPAMIWSTNYQRLVSQTVWTLFFAGKAYAPRCVIDGVNIQDWLQGHYLDAVGALAAAIPEDLYDACVLGWDSLNEPGEGYIGTRDLAVVPADQPLKKGPTPTPFEGMRLGMGEAVEVPNWDFGALGPTKNGTVRLDPKGVRLWLSPGDEATRGGGKWGWKRDPQWQLGTCIWAQHGVWDPSTSTLLQPRYFATLPSDPSRAAEFVPDFWRTHWLAYASRVRRHQPEAIHFIQSAVFARPAELPATFLAGRACASPHYYDGLTLMTKHWNWFNADALGLMRGKYWSVVGALRVGEAAIRKSIQDQLGILKADTATYGDFPTLIGEIGCPYDMDNKRAYGYVDGGRGAGDYSAQQKAWDASLNAADGPNALSYTLWTYVPDNSHEWGDLWNGEDLSIWSADDVAPDADADAEADGPTADPATPNSASTASTASTTTLAAAAQAPSPKAVAAGDFSPQLITDGARALAAFCRPYPIATVGRPARIDFDIKTSVFKLAVVVGPTDGGNATEVYFPFAHYAESLDVPAQPRSKAQSTGASASASTASSQASLLASSRPDTPAPALRLDIDVAVSAGEVAIAGQTLSWTYACPARETTLTLEVRRRGGPIRTTADERADGWGDVPRLLRQVTQEGLYLVRR